MQIRTLTNLVAPIAALLMVTSCFCGGGGDEVFEEEWDKWDECHDPCEESREEALAGLEEAYEDEVEELDERFEEYFEELDEDLEDSLETMEEEWEDALAEREGQFWADFEDSTDVEALIEEYFADLDYINEEYDEWV
ncbi:MAG: hypothetical protein HN348_27550, partial [Proteobacteria bacterium]|nr:hypothetical protein [Pseudomonadota bacterium]